MNRHVLVGLVAVLYVGFAWADGGYYPRMYAAATVAVWWLVIVAVALRLRPRAPIGREALGAGACLAGLAGLAALSLAWASDDGLAFAEAVRMAGYAGLFALVVAVSPPGSARAWLGGLALGIAGLAALSLLSRLQPGLTAEDAALVEALPGAAGRLSWPLSYWNGIAACMALGVVLCAWFGALGGARWSRAAGTAAIPLFALTLYFTSSRGGAIAVVAGLAALLVLDPLRDRLLAVLAIGAAGSAVVVFAASRSPDLVDGLATGSAASAGDLMTVVTLVVCAGVGLVAYLADGPLGSLRLPRPRPRVAIAAAVAAVAVLVVVVDPVPTFEEFKSPPQLTELTGVAGGNFDRGGGEGRWQLWGEAIDGFGEEPLRGLGAGGFGSYWNQNAPITFITGEAHSLYLETAAELGIVGVALLVGFLAAVGAAALKRYREDRPPELSAAVALALAGAVSAGFDWTRELPATFVPWIVAAALVCGPAMLAPRPRLAAVSGPNDAGAAGFGGRSSNVTAGLAVLAIAAASIWAAGLLFLTEDRITSAQEAVLERDLETAADDASSAATLEPWAAQPRLTEALVAEARGDLDEARDLLDEAIERAPEDWELWVAVSRVEQKRGHEEAAADAYERAFELNPRSPLFGLPAGTVPGQPEPATSEEAG